MKRVSKGKEMLKVGMKVKLVGPKDLSQKGDDDWGTWRHLAGREYYVAHIKSVKDSYPELYVEYGNRNLIYISAIVGSEIAGRFWEHWLQPIPAKGQAKCPLCGWPADSSFNLVYCHNSECRNGQGYGTNFNEFGKNDYPKELDRPEFEIDMWGFNK